MWLMLSNTISKQHQRESNQKKKKIENRRIKEHRWNNINGAKQRIIGQITNEE
jgi:hypothetical protein